MLDLDTWLFIQPNSAQVDSPSLQHHVGIASPTSLSIVFLGGEVHDTELSPDVTYSLELPSLLPTLSISSPPFLSSLPRAALAVLGLGLAVIAVLLFDWALREFRFKRTFAAVMPEANARDSITGARLRSASYSRMLGALQGIAGTVALWSLAALAAGWGSSFFSHGVSTGTQRVWPTAVATGLVLSTIVLATVLFTRHATLYKSRRDFDSNILRE